VAQPRDAGTGTALLLGLTHIGRRHPNAHVMITPADHGFDRMRPVERVLDAAFRRAGDRAAPVVLLGAEADSARTDFGWIVAGQRRAGRRLVRRFVEKPEAPAAAALLACGALWNTMLAVAALPAWLAQFARRHSHLIGPLMTHAALPAHEQGSFLTELYRSIEGVDLSRDVLEHGSALEVMAIPSRSGWSDLGTEERLLAHLARAGASRPSLEQAS
jgi:mannose-1-phosphate guanylyltransferase